MSRGSKRASASLRPIVSDPNRTLSWAALRGGWIESGSTTNAQCFIARRHGWHPAIPGLPRACENSGLDTFAFGHGLVLVKAAKLRRGLFRGMCIDFCVDTRRSDRCTRYRADERPRSWNGCSIDARPLGHRCQVGRSIGMCELRTAHATTLFVLT